MTAEATDLAAERAVQQRWRLRSQSVKASWFEELLCNEFATEEQQQTRLCEQLASLLRFCAANVPYYRDLFRRLALDPGDIRSPDDLIRLPVLQRADVQMHGDALRASQLPPGHSLAGLRKTSGSTGQPVVIAHTRQSYFLNNLLACRELRWFRADPGSLLASIRPPGDLPRRADGSECDLGEVCRLPSWPIIGNYFQTGAYIGFRGMNPLDVQLDWLREYQPASVVGLAANLEHLALTLEGGEAPRGLRNIVAIAQTMTADMRQCIEARFGVPVYEDYGLNEVGLIALRCPQAGRYHVNSEQCLVEIVDEQGHPVVPGQTGHLLVTSLINAAMPLIRYDTGDLAEAVAGPCPCGRTLPSFAGLRGRYSRVAFLPPGTLEHWVVLERILDNAPADHQAGLRQFQVHQFRDMSCELRIVAAAPLTTEFRQLVQNAWDSVVDGRSGMPLRIVQMEEIPAGRSHKFERFTSDFTPPPDYR